VKPTIVGVFVKVGAAVGVCVLGFTEGCCEGILLGFTEGSRLGDLDGELEGTLVG
jgi:hypothetical protein